MITRNRTALLFHRILPKITPRCYSIGYYSQSHCVAISYDITQNHTALLFQCRYMYVLKYCIATSLLKVAKFETKYLINCYEYKKSQLQKVLRILSSLQNCLFEISAAKITKVRILQF